MAAPAWTTVADAKAHPAFKGVTATEAVIGDTLATVELRIESEKVTGVAWVPRTATDVVVWPRSGRGRVHHTRCRSLLAVDVDGDPVSAEDLARWKLSRTGLLIPHRTVAPGVDVQVTYEHGADAPPDDLLDAAVRAAATLVAHQGNQRVGERTQALVADGQTINFAAIPDVDRGRPFGMPDVDQVVMSHAHRPPAMA